MPLHVTQSHLLSALFKPPAIYCMHTRLVQIQSPGAGADICAIQATCYTRLVQIQRGADTQSNIHYSNHFDLLQYFDHESIKQYLLQ
jgi:hypothetical protein